MNRYALYDDQWQRTKDLLATDFKPFEHWKNLVDSESSRSL